LGGVALFWGAAPRAAHALPKYAQTEKKPCIYCHNGPVGNANNSNYRAKFYKANALSFKGFDDAAEAAKAGVDVAPEATPPPASYSPPAATPDATPPPTPAATNPPGTPAMPPQPGRTPYTTLTVAQAVAKYKAAEAAYLKTPKNAALKKAFAQANAQLGRATMYDPATPPRTKYPAALGYYRKALALDPANKIAREDKKLVEDVYKQMGRPVPK
jgi:tetratricopeptide (TPR) repeat protein